MGICWPIVGEYNDVNMDGTVEKVIDNNGDKIKIKDYIYLEKDADNYYVLIIDESNKLYILDTNQIKTTKNTKVKALDSVDLEVITDMPTKEIELKFSNGKTIVWGNVF